MVGTQLSKLSVVKSVVVITVELIATLPPLQIVAVVGDMVGVAGMAFTVSIPVTAQPTVEVYVISDVPVPTPAKVPEDDPIVATPRLPLTHVPPDGAPDNAVLLPTHTVPIPDIVGTAFTVTVLVTEPQPE